MRLRRVIFAVLAFTIAGLSISILIAEAASLWSNTLCVGRIYQFGPMNGPSTPETNPELIALQAAMYARLLHTADAMQKLNPVEVVDLDSFYQSIETHLGFGVEIDNYEFAEGLPQFSTLPNYCKVQSGWPFRCMIATSFTLPPQKREWRDAISAPTFLRPARFMPTPPKPPDPLKLSTPLLINIIPSGLAINTAIFGSALWALFFTRATLITALRRRRNRCLACGYHRAGLAPDSPCPECGLQANTQPRANPDTQTQSTSISSPPAASLSSSPQASAASGPTP